MGAHSFFFPLSKMLTPAVNLLSSMFSEVGKILIMRDACT